MLGVYSTVFTFLITFLLFIFSKDFNNLDSTFKLIAQFSSLIAITAISLNYLLSIRTNLYSWIFIIFI